jgi:hypothetical protein
MKRRTGAGNKMRERREGGQTFGRLSRALNCEVGAGGGEGGGGGWAQS